MLVGIANYNSSYAYPDHEDQGDDDPFGRSSTGPPWLAALG